MNPIPANDNAVPIYEGSGNVFLDLGFDADEAARATVALAEFHAKGGRRYEDFKAELDATPPEPPAPGEDEKGVVSARLLQFDRGEI